MIVEDDPDLQFLLKNLLKAGYDAKVANNGVEALDVLQALEAHLHSFYWTSICLK